MIGNIIVWHKIIKSLTQRFSNDFCHFQAPTEIMSDYNLLNLHVTSITLKLQV